MKPVTDPVQTPQANAYFEDPTKYVARNPYIGFRSRVVRGLLDGLHDGEVLDVGAGNGQVTTPLLRDGNRLVFVDSSPGMIKLAMHGVPAAFRPRARAVCSSVMDFETAERFDAVVCVGVLAHVPSWREALRRLAMWLAPNGRLVLQLTDHDTRLGRLSHNIGKISSQLLHRATHAHAETGFSEVQGILQTHGLHLKRSVRHLFIPGLRLLPDSIAGTIVERSSQSWISKHHAGEVIALFAS
jgi:2-polyprenyl-3-methyl-5-hydroxy-6-metoxy-1,4-benzoquinol methylase